MGATEDYVKFVEVVSDNLLKKFDSESVKGLSGEDWEEIVFVECLTTREEIQATWEIIKTKSTEFPDIIIDDVFGIEVKSTKSDQWHSLGNSINESKRIDSVKIIYFLFGKLGGDYGVSSKPYEACLKSIATTHYPRYVVDMKLEPGASIFELLGISYDYYRKLDPDKRISLIKKYLIDNFEEGESLWWIDETTTPVLRSLNKLPAETKKYFTHLAMVRCPEIFGTAGNGSKYDRVAGLLLTELRAVSGNVRDFFSAGGKQTLTLRDGRDVLVPQVVSQLHDSAVQVEKVILNMPKEDLARDWKVQQFSGESVVKYVDVLSQLGPASDEIPSLGDIFLDGLKKE